MTAVEAVFALKDELRKGALDAVLAALPHPLLAVPLALLLPVLAGVGAHAVRRERARPSPPVPRHLAFPDKVGRLVGRKEELEQFMAMAAQSGVVVVRGAMGMGTSTLAAYGTWELGGDERAQRYADVRGPDRDHPETPLSVAQRVLRTLDRDPGAIQEVEDATAEVSAALQGLGKGRVLFLDNVSTWSQVSWLPPRVPGSLIVVAGSLTDELPRHIRPVEVGPLALEAGQELLADCVGGSRVRTEPDALRSLVRVCLNTPVEIVRLGRWLAHNPNVPLRTLVDDLERLPIGEKLRFVLDRSFKQLKPTAKRLFVLLAGLPIAEVDHQAAAALLGVPSVDDTIAELAERGLVENVRMTRVRVPDALRGSRETPQQVAAWRRLVEHFAGRAYSYAALLPDDDARAWFEIEDRVLLEVLAYRQPAPKTARALGRVADALESWFRLEQRHEDRLRAAESLSKGAKSLGNEHLRATAELRQCVILLTLGDPERAKKHFDKAAELRVNVESWPPELHLGHASILLASGADLSAVESALVRYGQALPGGDTAGQAVRLVNVAALLLREGQALDREGRRPGEARSLYTDARDVLFSALDTAYQAGDVSARAHAYELLALAHHYLDAPDEALSLWKEAEDLYGETSDKFGRARCLVQRAGAMLEDPGHRAEEVAELLESAEPRLPPAGVSRALAHLHLARLRPARAGEHRAAGLAALRSWDVIAAPPQVKELRTLLSQAGSRSPSP